MNWKVLALILCIVHVTNAIHAGSFNIALENDVIAGTDQHYTHGTKFLYFTDAPSYFDNVFEDKQKEMGIALAQYMYTPSDIGVSELIEDDRPYGGWFYLEALLIARDNTWLDMFGVNLGTTGKESLSEDTQKWIHEMIDSEEPMGWDHQIDSEIGVNLLYQKKYRWRTKWIDVIPSAGGSLGNIFTYLDAGCTIRGGYNLPDDFGMFKVEPATRVKNGFVCYSFFSAEGRWVLRNIFLDGNTFEDSHSVDKEDLIADLIAGIGIGYGNLELIYSNTFRSREFKGQEHSNRFGTIVLSWKL